MAALFISNNTFACVRNEAGTRDLDNGMVEQERQKLRQDCLRQEKLRQRHLDETMKKMRRKERLCQKKEARECRNAKIVDCQKHGEEKRAEKVRIERYDRDQKRCKWAQDAPEREAREEASGMYADLYLLPTWPIHLLFWEDKNFFNVTFDYSYAIDCYDSNRSGSKSNITRLAFGQNPITVQSILLASKLVAAGRVMQNDPIAPGSDVPSDIYLNYLANEVIAFNGRAEQYGITFDLCRYIVNTDIAIGVQIPVHYRHNRLRIHSNLPASTIPPQDNGVGAFGPFTPGTPAPPGPAFGYANAFLRRYGADPVRFVKDILSAKGINQIGGSASGLGDVAVFINGQFNSVWFQKAVIGLRAQFPTGKRASQTKLWLPDLGNGGFTEITPCASVLFGYNQWLNPFIVGQVSFAFGAYVDRRVPKIVNIPVNDTGSFATVATLLTSQQAPFNRLAFGDRVGTPDGAAAINGQYDTTVKSFGDTISNVKLYKGTECKFRVGNIFDRFFSRRGALNVFYDFRTKQKDKATELPTDLYNLEILRVHTNQLEHRIGFDYTYQFDLYARLHLAIGYTFSGMNVPKTFDVSGSFNYAF